MLKIGECGLIFCITLLTSSWLNASTISVEKRFQLEQQLEELIKEQPYIVSIYCETSKEAATLSGFFVNSYGYVATAGHAPFKEAKKIEVVLKSGQRFKAHFIDEIQTLDLAVLLVESKTNKFPVASFLTLKKLFPQEDTVKHLYWFEISDKVPAEERFVVFICTDKNSELVLNRIYIGEIASWGKDDPEITVSQSKGNDACGCSGTPVITRQGKVIGMANAAADTTVYLLDADSISRAVRLIIKKDRK